MLRSRLTLLTLLLLIPSLAQAQPTVADEDGFTRPLERLTFNPGLDQREFERSTLLALAIPDPLEPWNRRVYHFNQRFDEWVLLPVVNAYQAVTPRVVRSGVSNFFNNLADVGSLANSLLQLKGQRAMNSTARLLFNTILGLGGIWDPATRMGLPRQPEDFGQTLGHYGVDAGPYLVLPLLGPSNLRDTAGLVTDYGLGNAVNYLDVADASSDNPAITVLRAVDLRAHTGFRYGQLNSPFEYEKVRYLYHESRKLKIAD